MLGIYCGGEDVASYVTQLEQAGLLVVQAGTKVIRLLPPLTVSESEMDEAVAILQQILCN